MLKLSGVHSRTHHIVCVGEREGKVNYCICPTNQCTTPMYCVDAVPAFVVITAVGSRHPC